MLLSNYHQDDKTQGQQAISPYFSGSVDYAPTDNPFFSASYPVNYVVGLFYQQLKGSNGQTQWVPGQTFFSNLPTGFPGSSADTYGDTNFIVANTTDFKDRPGWPGSIDS